MLEPRSMLEPQIGDIVIRRIWAQSAVQYYLYQSLEDLYLYHKTWLLKIFSCHVSYPMDRNLDANTPRSIKCMMLMVWEYGLGFKEFLTGGILLPESLPTDAAEEPGLGRGGSRPDKNTIVLAFWQPTSPRGPTFLRIDFWKDKYFDEDYAKLMVLSVVDSLSHQGTPLRTITCWSRDGTPWDASVLIIGALAQYAPMSLTEVSS